MEIAMDALGLPMEIPADYQYLLDDYTDA